MVTTRALSASWRSAGGGLVTSEAEALRIAQTAKRVAVLGIKTERQASQPAFYVPEYLKSVGIDIVPVPVYFPDVTHILDAKCYRTISAIPNSHEIDVVDVFRRPKDLHQHLDDIIAAKPKSVWLQSGITDKAFEEAVAAAGILVVSDRCLLLDHQQAMTSSL